MQNLTNQTKKLKLNSKKKRKNKKQKVRGNRDVNQNMTMVSRKQMDNLISSGLKKLNSRASSLYRNPRMEKHLRDKVYTTYTRSLVCPENVRHAKIPSTLPLPTVSYHLKRSFNVTTNGTGQLAILINPWYLSDTTSNTTWILYNNDTLLNVNTGNGGGLWQSLSMSSNISAGNASAYRLVSASIQIYPENTITNTSGYLAGGIVTAANMAASYGVTTGISPGAAFNQSNVIDNLLYYQKSQLAGQQGVRAIYLPFDPTFEMFMGLNSGRATISTQIDQFFWNYYVAGAPANQNMVIEIYWNFELEPQPISLLQSIADVSVPFESDAKAIKTIQQHDGLVSQASPNLNSIVNNIDELLVSGGKNTDKEMGFLDQSINFLNEHAAELGSVIKLGISAFA